MKGNIITENRKLLENYIYFACLEKVNVFLKHLKQRALPNCAYNLHCKTGWVE